MATKTRQLADFLVAGGVSDAEIQSVPHIRPGILQPAVAGKLLDGTTDHGSTYGVAQSDGHSYYYTDIKGSKPIKDPRIGAHFGSQRHKGTSLQFLEQETATHGQNVYSVDGREWFRATGPNPTTNHNQQAGAYNSIQFSPSTANDWIEVVGYFNNVNVNVVVLSNSADDVNIYIDGTDTGNNYSTRGSVNSPLFISRYVAAGSLVNLNVGSLTTPGIHTLKIGGTTTYHYVHSLELIAQDTTSTANKSKIQIPAQNVVSYGKKFTVSGTPHYDPFNGFTNSTTLFSANVDTATSLGLGTGTTYGAPWAISSSNHIRPYNGGRVVKWVDSSGTIKTSVTMMPANAQNIKTLASNEITTASATNTHTLNFSDDAVDYSLSELAKRFHIREFGNGSANAGTGGSYKDISMAHATQEVRAYVMDDGLTSFSGDKVKTSNNDKQSTYIQGDNGYWHLTFIGTGVTIIAGGYGAGTYKIAINLPYGTHILKCVRDADGTPDYTLDGVALDDVTGNTYGDVHEIDIFQPKKPPVPEDACIIADYMLMADFVGIPASTTANAGLISKGTRFVSPSRDMFYNTPNDSFTFVQSVAAGYPEFGFAIYTGSGNTTSATLPFFGVNADVPKYDNRTKLCFDAETSESGVTIPSSTNGNWHHHSYKTANLEVGVHTVKHLANNTHWNHGNVFIASPIHTSSHYQTFETPYLHELVGGDRNMEQNNLIVTADGKSWDEVTRNTSYIGKMSLQMTTDTHHGGDAAILMDDWRGWAIYSGNDSKPCFNKDFAIAHDRFICLRDGQYLLYAHSHSDSTNDYLKWMLNGAIANMAYTNLNDSSLSTSTILNLKRGDNLYLQGVYGEHWTIGHSSYITRIS